MTKKKYVPEPKRRAKAGYIVIRCGEPWVWKLTRNGWVYRPVVSS